MTFATGLAEHLERPLAQGHVPAGAHTGAAGGAACGDLIRVSLVLDPDAPDGRILDAGFDASGCGATIAAGSAVVALLRGDIPLLQAATIGPETIARELGGLSPAKRHAAELAADALHRALGSALRQASLCPVTDRTLVAMSGGVDSAVAALLTAGVGDETVAVTLFELWSDPANDGDLSCCSAQAVRSARSLAHDLGVPHFSIDLRAEFRAGVGEPWLSHDAAGLTPNPCVRCNGLGAPGRDARSGLPAGLAHARDRPLRAHRSRRARARPVAARGRRSGQGPELRAERALAPNRSSACASRWAS